jgi:hypothetical protein
VEPSTDTVTAPAPAAAAAGAGGREDVPVAARLVLGVLAVVAVVPFRVLLADDRWLLGAAGAAALTAGVSRALSPRRPLAVAVGAAVAALALAAAGYLAATGVPVGPDLAAGLARLPVGWPTALLRAPLPAAPTPENLALPVGGAAVAAFAAAEVAARSRRAVPGAVAPAALLVVALVYAGRHASGTAAVVGVLVAGVLAVAALDRAPTPRRGLHRLAGPVLALLAGAGCVVVAALTPATSAPRYGLGDRYVPARRVTEDANPLAQAAAALAAADDPVVFRVTLAPAADGARLRLRVATLDDYDGTVWRVSRTFGAVGDLLPRRYPVDVAGPPVVQRVALTPAYTGPFVPELAAPVEVGAPGREWLRFDPESGDLVAVEGRPADLRYELVSPAGPASSAPQGPTGDRLAALTALPEPVPAELRTLVRGLAERPPRQRVETLVGRVRDGPSGYDVLAPPGHSYPRLTRFLGGGPAEGGGGMAGTIEQPPAAFAVLARLAGVPARVVVGYDVAVTGTGAGAGVGVERTVAVTARQVRAWAEVHLDGEGWVPVDVTRAEPRAPAAEPPPGTTSTTAVEAGRAPAAATEPAPDPSSAGEPCRPPAGDCDPPTAGVPWRALAAGAVPVLPVAVAGAKGVRRRRRRRRREPARRLVGAWQETMACLRGRGVRVPPAMTVTEVVARHAPVLGEQAVASLSRWVPLLDTAVYAAAEPDDDLADEAWNAHAALAEALRARTGRVRRLVLAADPRPLLARGR